MSSRNWIWIIINPLRDYSPYPGLLLPCALCASTHVHVIRTWYMLVLYLCASPALCFFVFGTLTVLIVDMSALSLVSVCMSDTLLFPTLLSQSGGVCLARSLPLRAWHFGFQPVKQLYFIYCFEPCVCPFVCQTRGFSLRCYTIALDCALLTICFWELGTLASIHLSSCTLIAALSSVSVYMFDTWLFPALLLYSVGVSVPSLFSTFKSLALRLSTI